VTFRRFAQVVTALALSADCSRDAARRQSPEGDVAPVQGVTNVPMAPGADCAARTVSGDSVGHVRIGMALDVLRRMCPVLRDTIVQPVGNLPKERRVSFLIGADTAEALVNHGRIWEVSLAGAAFRTADSLGVGTPLRRLLAFTGVRGYGLDELLVATPARCGLTFGIAGRYAGVPPLRDSAVLAAMPTDAVVDRILIDGCDRDDGNLDRAADDSTYDVQTDSVALARDLDGNRVVDYVVLETRPFRRDYRHLYRRLALYLDSIPATRRASWATAWSDETDDDLGEVKALGARGSLVVLLGSEGDYTSETLLSVRDGTITEEINHGEDYGNGFLEVTTEGGTLVVDASQDHFLVRGAPVKPELECSDDWAAVRSRWDDAARRFVPERPRCIKPKLPDGGTSP
jgi:hypothetical protein